MFEGLTKNYTVRDMVYPTISNLTDKLNSGSMTKGNLYIDPVTTPVVNNIYGATALRSFYLLTGVNYDNLGQMYETVDTVGMIRDIDDGNGYIWLRQMLFDGVDWNSAMWYDEDVGLQYTYDPGFPTGSQYDLKLALQNAP